MAIHSGDVPGPVTPASGHGGFSEDQDGPDTGQSPPNTASPGAPLVIVASAGTLPTLRQMVAVGWTGPIVVVGTVREAQHVLESWAGESSAGANGSDHDVPGAGEVAHDPVPYDRPAPVRSVPDTPDPRPTTVATGAVRDLHEIGGTAGEDLGFRLDQDRHLLVCGYRECALTPLEFGVLEALAEAPGEVRQFGQLTRRVWGMAHVGDGGQVHAVIRRVRRKLDLVHAPASVMAVRGVGFRLVAQPAIG